MQIVVRERMKDKNKLLDYIYIIILMTLVLADINKFNQPVILNDEFGYWSIAAQWAGKHWEGLIPYTPYYSYGYSVILIPLFWICDNTVYIYRIAIMMNAGMLIIDYFLLKWIARKVFSYKDINIISTASFITCLYPNTIYQCQVAWPETLLFTLFIVLSCLFFSYEEKASMVKGIGICFTIVYMYMVHKRTIFIAIVGLMVFVYLQLLERTRLKKAFLMILFCVIGIAVANLISKNNIKILWNSSSKSAINSVSVSLVGNYLSKIKNNIFAFIASVFGKFGYYFLVTGPVVLSGMWFCIKEIINKMRDIPRKYQFSGSYFFLVASFSVSVGVCILSTIEPRRLDAVVYGRYAENAIGIIILFGILNILDNKEDLRLFFLSVILMIFMSISINNSIKWVELNAPNAYYNTPCATGLGGLYNMIGDKSLFIWTGVLFQIIITTIVGAMKYYKKNKCHQVRNIEFLILGIVGLSWMLAFHYSKPYLEDYRVEFDKDYYDIIMPILEENENNDLVYIMDRSVNEYCISAKRLQYVAMDRKINVIEIENIRDNLPKGTILLAEKRSSLPSEIMEKLELLCDPESTVLLLYQVK